ncbi:MAG: glycosyltransferase family 4 protein, partial [Myxococcota bacterium]
MSSSPAFTLAFPGPPERLSGGTRYDRAVCGACAARGADAATLVLRGDFPRPSQAARREALAQLRAVPRARLLVVDGLALGALPEEMAELAQERRVVALCHHPLADEGPGAADLAAGERASLAWACGVLATSAATARSLSRDYGVPAASVAVARPGVAPWARAQAARDARRRAGPLRVLVVGALSPRKAQRALVATLAPLSGEVTLTLVGSDADAAYAGALRGDLAGLADRQAVRLLGSVSDAELAALHGEADLFVSASRHEGYGMAVADALAAGLPVVARGAGALAALVPPALQVPTDAALADRVVGVAADPAARGPGTGGGDPGAPTRRIGGGTAGGFGGGG